MLVSLKPKKRVNSGFTLIELLVVIAIIAILAAILFPVFAQAREKARQTACLSNMKQLATGLMMYVQDFDESFPPSQGGLLTDPRIPAGDSILDTRYAMCRVTSYIKNAGVFLCPSDQDTKMWIPLEGRPEKYSYFITNVNNVGTTDPYTQAPSLGWGVFRTGEARTLAEIKAPADTIAISERDGRNPDEHVTSYVDFLPWNPALGARVTGQGRLTERHSGGGNHVFADGHVKWYKPLYLYNGLQGVLGWHGFA